VQVSPPSTWPRPFVFFGFSVPLEELVFWSFSFRRFFPRLRIYSVVEIPQMLLALEATAFERPVKVYLKFDPPLSPNTKSSFLRGTAMCFLPPFLTLQSVPCFIRVFPFTFAVSGQLLRAASKFFLVLRPPPPYFRKRRVIAPLLLRLAPPLFPDE